MKRLQARRAGGRWTRNTPENTMGLHIAVCPVCRIFNPSRVGEARPLLCHACGSPLATCADGRCTEQFPSKPYYVECGKPAVASSVEYRWGLCVEHCS